MPIKLALNLRPAGVCLRSALPGEEVSIETGGFHCSAEGETFSRIVEGLSAEYLAAANTLPSQVDNLLVIVDPNNEATIYCNEIATRAFVQSKVSTTIGQLVKKDDLADIREVHLDVEIPKDCGFVFIFSLGWRKGMLFDFGPLQSGVVRSFDPKRALAACQVRSHSSESRSFESLWNQIGR